MIGPDRKTAEPAGSVRSAPCPWCDGSCAQPRFAELSIDDLAWLWAQLAAVADRSGNVALVSGGTMVAAPDGVTELSAGRAVLGRVELVAGKRVRVDLAQVAARCAPVTPGALAAHAVRRPLAPRHAARNEKAQVEKAVVDALVTGLADTTTPWSEIFAAQLRRSGALTRLCMLDDPAGVAIRAAGVLAVLDGGGTGGEGAIDRRRLATETTGDPHALDTGSPLASCVLALLAATARVDAGLSPRLAWESAGVTYDDLIGGLTMCGVAPFGWSVPAGEPVTVPPRVLATCDWPRRRSVTSGRAFITENPSILTAVLDAGIPDDTAVVCLAGTPARAEVAALARLAATGWELYVRADFDDAGLAHVRAVLDAVPDAVPWRMGVDDYLTGLERSGSQVPLRAGRLGATPWDERLASVMAARRTAVFEESFCDELVADVLAIPG